MFNEVKTRNLRIEVFRTFQELDVEPKSMKFGIFLIIQVVNLAELLKLKYSV